ncbi:hypothetical protein FACS1894191_7250 [Clostridia bacterium]|nr:hypothetical protein FACS1894191_7250 [Clostridia bacterium]
MRAALEVFIETYNHFGKARQLWREIHETEEVPFSVIHFL